MLNFVKFISSNLLPRPVVGLKVSIRDGKNSSEWSNKLDFDWLVSEKGVVYRCWFFGSILFLSNKNYLGSLYFVSHEVENYDSYMYF